MNRYSTFLRSTGRASRSGFTLIELLVVIAIIAVLASISVPVISRAMESAKRAQANTEVMALSTAIRAYYNEYSRFPHHAQDKSLYIDGNSDLLSVLRAQDDELNRRRIVFIEVSDRSLSKDAAGEVEPAPSFIDPWGQPYNVAVDINFNNQVDTGNPDLGENGIVRNRIVAVWSDGSPEAEPTKYITSW